MSYLNTASRHECKQNTSSFLLFTTVNVAHSSGQHENQLETSFKAQERSSNSSWDTHTRTHTHSLTAHNGECAEDNALNEDDTTTTTRMWGVSNAQEHNEENRRTDGRPEEKGRWMPTVYDTIPARSARRDLTKAAELCRNVDPRTGLPRPLTYKWADSEWLQVIWGICRIAK